MLSLLVSIAGVVSGLDAQAGLDLSASRSFEHPWDVQEFGHELVPELG